MNNSLFIFDASSRLSQSEGLSNTQTTDILTQNQLTQLDDHNALDDTSQTTTSPLAPLASPSSQRPRPWGRLMPMQAGQAPISLYPPPTRASPHNDDDEEEEETDHRILLGRSNKCHVTIRKPTPTPTAAVTTTTTTTTAYEEWAYGMISNQHCCIYQEQKDVYIEDMSGNGTLVNQVMLLRKGQRRILHTGDEICLVNPQSLKKKVKSATMLQELLLSYSFVFCHVSLPLLPSRRSSLSLHDTVMGTVLLDASSQTMTGSASKRKAAVDPFAQQRRISPRRTPSRRVEVDYDIRDLLGRGTVGEVRRAIDRKTGMARAVKIIQLTHRPAAWNAGLSTTSAVVEAEASILKGLEHPYIVTLIDYYVSDNAVYLIMELLPGGDLFDRILSKGKYPEPLARQVMRRLLSAVYYLHEVRNIVHRDLKPENILLCSLQNDVEIQLTDFGLAKHANDGLKTFCGTPLYFAPEILQRRHTVLGRGRYGKEADMWSLGIILYILLSGIPPFDMNHAMEQPIIDFPEEYWKDVSESAKQLVQDLLVTNPKQRLTVVGACHHAWILIPDANDTHVYPLSNPKLLPSHKCLDAMVSRMDQTNSTTAATSPMTTTTITTDAMTQGRCCREDHEESTKHDSFIELSNTTTNTNTNNNSTDQVVTGNGEGMVAVCQPNVAQQQVSSKNDRTKLRLENDNDLVEQYSRLVDNGVLISHDMLVPKKKCQRLTVQPNSKDMVSSVGSKIAKHVGKAAIAGKASTEKAWGMDSEHKTPGKKRMQLGDKKALDGRRSPLLDISDSDCNARSIPSITRKPHPMSSEKETTPNASNRTAEAIKVHACSQAHEQQQQQQQKSRELSDDEILSQFSEQSESISSFGTGTGTLEVHEAKQETPALLASSTIPRKRRVTESIGDNRLSPSIRKSSRAKTEASIKPKTVVKGSSNTKQRGKDDKGQRGKQTTLVNWFKNK